MLVVGRDDITVKEQGGGVVRGNLKHKAAYVQSGKIVIGFDGVDTALRYVRDKMPRARQHESSIREGRASFNAFATYDEALDTFLHHPEKIRKFTEKDLRLGGGDAAGVSVEYGVTGDYIDIDRYLSGEPECFGSMYNGQPRGQRAYIVLNNSWISNVDFKVIQLRSRRVLRLIDWLEQQGIRCKVMAIESSDQLHVETVVKDYDQPLDINAMAIVSHPEWLRRIMFRIAEHTPDLDGGYGVAVHFENHILSEPGKVAEQSGDANAINIYVGNGADEEGMANEFDEFETALASLLDASQTGHEAAQKEYDAKSLLTVNVR